MRRRRGDVGDADDLRPGARPLCGELCAAVAAELHRTHGGGLSRPHWRWSTARVRRTWAETYARCRRLASALAARGIGRGDTVAVMAANIPAMLRGAFRRADDRAPCSTRSTPGSMPRRSPSSCEHGEAKVLLTDREFAGSSASALADAGQRAAGDRHRRSARRRGGERLGDADYEEFLADGDPAFRLAAAGRRMGGDRAQLHLRHHRQSQGRRLSPSRRLSERARQRRSPGPCRRTRSICGRCRCSTATAGASPGRSPRMAGTHVCLRRVDAGAIFDADRRRAGHPSLRRADRAEHAGQRAGRAATRLRASTVEGDDRRRRAARRGDRRHGGAWASTSPMSTA